MKNQKRLMGQEKRTLSHEPLFDVPRQPPPNPLTIMDRDTAIALRLAHQQLSHTTCESPVEVVDRMGMMQSQDYKHFRWAIAMRTKTPRLAAVAEAFVSGDLLRLHLFRCTVQTVTRRDLPWMLPLCRERNLRTISSWPSYNLTDYSEAYLQEATDALKTLLAGGKSLSKAEISTEMARQNFPSDTPHLNQLLLRGEIEGVICSGALRGKGSTWALLSERLDANDGEVAEDEALARLAQKYFQSHSPASFEDFCWWTGLPKGKNRRAVECIASKLEEMSVVGQPMFVYKDDVLLEPLPLERHILFLPPYDEYLIGYKSRWVVLDKEHEARAHNNRGIFKPVILYDGRVVGNWKADIDHRAAKMETDVFARRRELSPRRLQKAMAELTSFSV